MSDRPPLRPGEDGSAFAHLYSPNPYAFPAPETVDALTDPQPGIIARTLYALLPVGAAWQTPDAVAFKESSRLGGFLRSFAGAISETYRRLYRLSLESSGWSLSDSLTDWEIDHSLPDPCIDGSTDSAIRHQMLMAKIRSMGIITPADFVALAASVGFAVTIEEPQPFRFGDSELIDDGHELAGSLAEGGAIEYFWIVSISGQPHFEFEFGVSECGTDRLTDWIEALVVECLFRRYAPAWTRPLFIYP